MNGRDFLIEYFGEHGGNPAGSTVCSEQWSKGMACWVEGTEKLQPGPFPGGQLCSCQDSTNNTYACVRRVNGGYGISNSSSSSVVAMGMANNFLYCQFNDNDSFEEYYDVDEDPWQLKNTIDELSDEELMKLRVMLQKFRKCRGREQC